jgi:CubicO group peptidase (beta-lactamase class C family)
MSTLNSEYHISGTVEKGYEAVLDAFVDNFKLRHDVGACFVGYHKGRKVVDLWGGYANPTEKVLWQENTMINTYSTTKGMAITCMLHLVDKGLCKLEDLVVDHWPEFGAEGKGAIRITELLSHRAGLSYLDTPITVEMIEQARVTLDSTLARALAAQKPLWQLSEGKHGYSPIIVGFYLSQLVRRIDPQHRSIR